MGLNSDYLDVAVGLVVVFFLASLVVSGLNEGFQFATRARAKFLWAYLYRLVSPSDEAPTLRAVAPPDHRPGAAVPTAVGIPTAPPAATADDVLDLDAPPGSQPPSETSTLPPEAVLGRLQRALQPVEPRQRRSSEMIERAMGSGYETRTAIKSIPAPTLAQAWLEVFADVGDDPHRPDQDARERIEAAIARLEGTPFHATALRLWESVDRDLTRFRLGLEHWIDAEWARLSGLYRRNLRWVLIGFGVLVAVVLNVDALALTRDLWRNPEGRSALVAQADTVLATPDPAGGDRPAAPALQQLRDACEAKVGTTGGEATPAEVAQGFEDVRNCITDTLDGLVELRVVDDSLVVSPTAWLDEWVPGYRTAGEGTGDWWRHLLGVAITAGALGLGASFWFDLLKRITGLRRTLVRTG